MVTQFLLLSLLLITSVSFWILIFPSPITSFLSPACFNHIRNLRCISPVHDIDTARVIRTSFVHSILDYCNSMYYCLPQTQLNHLQHFQNALARVVVAAPRSSNPNHILKLLHWLKVQKCIEYKVIFTTYKHLQSFCPCYLRDLITVQPS